MKIFLFFIGKAIKIAGSAQKTGSVGLAETRVNFLGLTKRYHWYIRKYRHHSWARICL